MIDYKQILANRIQEASYELAPFFAMFMRKGEGTPSGKYKKGRVKSTSKKLGLLTGNLSRSLVPKGAGNINRIAVVNGVGVWEFGIDLEVIKYARIHEMGGTVKTKYAEFEMPARPYLAPGIEAFDKNQMSNLLQNIFNDIQAAWNKETLLT